MRVGGSIASARKIYDVPPVYPDIAKQARVSGIVILEAAINVEGNVSNLRVLRSIPQLDRAAMDAVRQWKYEPALLNGVAVPVVATITVNFTLPSPTTSSTIICRIEAAKETYQVGEAIELVVILENTTRRNAAVPSTLSIPNGTARFQILDTDWKTLPHPSPQPRAPETTELRPGERASFRLLLNGEEGYRLDGAGRYHIVFLGTGIGLPNSNTLTLRLQSSGTQEPVSPYP